jgi:hypothetical protein
MPIEMAIAEGKVAHHLVAHIAQDPVAMARPTANAPPTQQGMRFLQKSQPSHPAALPRALPGFP